MKPDATAPRAGRDWLAALLLVAAIGVAFHNSLGGPFLFDDVLAIVENPTIRDPASWEIFRPPAGQGLTVEGRPLLNASFALNYALSGTAVGSYHCLNLAIHAAAALALFGAVSRTLRLPGFAPAWRESARGLGLAVALLWAVHPLQTESVTYVVQRAESLMGASVFFTLYAFIRGASPGGDRRWFVAAVAGAWAGAAAKEVAAAAPVLALLYDRTFLAGTFRGAWARRARVHVGLMSSWLLNAVLVAGAGSRGGTVGFGSNVGWFDYALTQGDSIARYVLLGFWPQPLVFDYGTAWVRSVSEVLPQLGIVLALVGGTVLALRTRPRVGFLGVCFLAPLAPTSLVPGNRQTMAEHRMYLPLAATTLAAVMLARGALQRRHRALPIAAAALVAGGLALLTVRRNADYRSALVLYRDTALKRPDNAFARYNLGKVLAESGQPAAAVAEYRAALAVRPELPLVPYNLGNALAELGRTAEAEAAFRDGLRRAPQHARSHFNLGNLLIAQGRKAEALAAFTAAVAQDPGFVEARLNRGGVLLDLGRLDEAEADFTALIAREPSSALAHVNLGHVHYLRRDFASARREYETARRLAPELAAVRVALERLGSPPN